MGCRRSCEPEHRPPTRRQGGAWLFAAAALVVAAFAGTSGQAADDGAITVLIHKRAPYYVIENGQISGIIAEPAARAFKNAGLKFSWHELASNRQLKRIEQNADRSCAVGWFKKPEREAFARFTDPIYVDRPMVVLARSDNSAVASHTMLKALIADPSLRFGRKLGYSYGAVVDDLLVSEKTVNLTTTQDNFGMVRMLLGRRFDYMFASYEEAAGLIDSVGAASDDLVALTLGGTPPGNARHILCSKNVSDAEIERLNEAIARLSDGSADGG